MKVEDNIISSAQSVVDVVAYDTIILSLFSYKLCIHSIYYFCIQQQTYPRLSSIRSSYCVAADLSTSSCSGTRRTATVSRLL